MRLRRKIFIALGVVLGMAILAAWFYHWRLKSINEAYIVQLAAHGEPMTLAQVLPPPVPTAENSADTFLRAAALLEADTSLLSSNACSAMLQVAPGRAAPSFQQSQAIGYNNTNSWREMNVALVQNQTALKLLQQIADHPAFDYHVHYESGMGADFNFTNLHLVELKKSVRFLSSASVVALHNGDAAGAVANQRAMLALVTAMRSQRLEISELVRIAMMQIASHSCWEILQAPGPTGDQLALLQTGWEKLNFIQGSEDALAMERFMGEITLSNWRSSPSGLKKYLDLGSQVRETMGVPESQENLAGKFATDAEIFLWRFWWSYPDELRSLRGYQVLLGSVRFAATNASFQTAIANQQSSLDNLQISKLPEEFSSMFSDDTDFHSLMSQSIVSLSGITRKVMTAEAARRITITAIALQRFKLAHGHYPAHLSSMVPDFLAALPLDPVDGQPLRYQHRSDGGFLLYSIGENGVDDGGDPTPAGHATPKSFYWQSPSAQDWVWPQAITAEDVQFIYPPTAK